jgi:hypothetical protein
VSTYIETLTHSYSALITERAILTGDRSTVTGRRALAEMMVRRWKVAQLRFDLRRKGAIR